jgi:hypothetical protein
VIARRVLDQLDPKEQDLLNRMIRVRQSVSCRSAIGASGQS